MIAPNVWNLCIPMKIYDYIIILIITTRRIFFHRYFIQIYITKCSIQGDQGVTHPDVLNVN